MRLLAEAVATGQLDLDGSMDPEATTRRLVAIPGIGPWTAAYIAMRALREPDAFPATDLILKRCLETHRSTRPGEDCPSLAWRPWRAYAAMYLWRNYVESAK